MSSSDYKNFTGQGHADKGHWNDPPAQVFANPKASDPQGNLGVSSPDAATPNLSECSARLKKILETITPTGAPDYKRKLDDTSMRLKQLDAIEPSSISPDIFAALLLVVESLEKNDLASATKYHTQMMLSNYESNSKWLIGLKRLVDLKKETQ